MRVSKVDLSQVRIFNRYGEVAPFLQAVSSASDAHRNLLGFVRRGVFEELARRNDLFILAIHKGDDLEYGGHLLFARRYPRAKVLQLFVQPQYRAQGCGRLLCDRLVELLSREGFTSIYARVGEDMRDANEAWQAMGFSVQRTEPGGITTGRTIVVRVRELDTPQLFPPQKIDQADPLGLGGNLSSETPLFLVDLNVLFDLSPSRARHDEALLLFQTERANFCRLAISEEMIAELARTGPVGQPDLIMNLARTFTRFPVSSVNLDSPMVAELAQLVFPSKSLGGLKNNDVSDLRHLVTAIENDLAGLITNDQALLKAAQEVESRFGVQVLSPKAFAPEESQNRGSVAYELKDSPLELVQSADSDEADVQLFLGKLGVTGSELVCGWCSRASINYVIRSGRRVVAYVCWPALRTESVTTIRAAVDESAPDALQAARGVMTHCMNLIVDGPTSLRLRTPPNQVLLRDIARGLGFCRGQNSSDLTKLAFGRVATKGNWSQRRSELADTAGLRLETQFPLYRRIEQQVSYVTRAGESGYVTLEKLETLLSPALFCLPGRPTVITPIRHKYANPLLGHSRQRSLLPAPASNLFRERHFISGRNSFNNLKRGSLMFFYESNPPRGKGELVAIARVRRSYLKDSAALADADLAQSVLSPETLGDIGSAEMKTVTVFDNMFPLPSPIALNRLQQLGCGLPHELITTRSIGETQVQAILAEAFKE